jgi:hypothetical protein
MSAARSLIPHKSIGDLIETMFFGSYWKFQKFDFVSTHFDLIDTSRQRLRLLIFFRVRAAFFAETERTALGREAAAFPPSLPPFLAGLLLTVFPRPEPPGFFPPCVIALTVAQALRSDSFSDSPRSS